MVAGLLYNMGHTDETFTEPLFLDHLWAGLQYVMGGDAAIALDYSKAKPEENRFSKVVLAEKLNEPMELTVLNDGRVLFIERHGAVKPFNTKNKATENNRNNCGKYKIQRQRG